MKIRSNMTSNQTSYRLQISKASIPCLVLFIISCDAGSIFEKTSIGTRTKDIQTNKQGQIIDESTKAPSNITGSYLIACVNVDPLNMSTTDMLCRVEDTAGNRIDLSKVYTNWTWQTGGIAPEKVQITETEVDEWHVYYEFVGSTLEENHGLRKLTNAQFSGTKLDGTTTQTMTTSMAKEVIRIPGQHFVSLCTQVTDILQNCRATCEKMNAACIAIGTNSDADNGAFALDCSGDASSILTVDMNCDSIFIPSIFARCRCQAN